MEAQLVEPLSFPAQNYAESFISKRPTDSRFLLNNYQKFMPLTNIEAETITFQCSRFESPSIYQIQKCLLEVRISITKANGEVPDTAKNVAVINNIGHSMWEAVRLYINDDKITSSGGLYPYKAYISDVLSYDGWVQTNQLSQQGWYGDTSGHMDGENGNLGFLQRSAIFRKDFEANGVYRKSGATFFTRLHHELVACTTGLPPGTKFKEPML